MPELTTTQRRAFESIPRWPSAFVESLDYAEAVFLAGWNAGMTEQRADDRATLECADGIDEG